MMDTLSKLIDNLLQSQLLSWELAKNNYEGLASVETQTFLFGEIDIFVQFNPKRLVSSAAKVDAKSIEERKCFLCTGNRPAKQIMVDFIGKYEVLVNPFPIFPRHLTIPACRHTRQEILGRLEDMLSLSEGLPEFVVFYNGPKCGASAPDHFHFQAGNKGFLPLEKSFHSLPKKVFEDKNNIQIGTIPTYPCALFFFESADKERIAESFAKLQGILPIKQGEYEAMMNIVAWKNEANFVVCVFPRAKHRPDCFFAEDEKNILLSPASVDMGGVFITPQEKDFRKITERDIQQIIAEVCISKSELQEIAGRLKIS